MADLKPPLAATAPLSFTTILQMNLGFLGLQFSFGLQQSNMAPIYAYLGAGEAVMPLLWLAGPVTGLIVQPVVGALSDRTLSRHGRRSPYLLLGAFICSAALVAMPLSQSLLVAVMLLWILDAGNNITLDPYRAYVSDRLGAAQRSAGFLVQSAFTGLAQTLSYLTPSLLVWAGMSAAALDRNGVPAITRTAFFIGALLSLMTMLWSIRRVPELPVSGAGRAAAGRSPRSLRQTFRDLASAFAGMPPAMRQLALPMLFQWYAMFAYWQYVVFALADTLYGTRDPASPGFREAVLMNGQLGAFYNFIAFLAAFAMVPSARRWGERRLHAFAVLLSGLAMIAIPVTDDRLVLFGLMIGIGLGWGSLMGNPYAMLARAIPPDRTGVYMGLFNMFIVIPMLVESLTMPLVYGPLLGGDPGRVLMLAGLFMLIAAALTLRVPADGAPVRRFPAPPTQGQA